MGEYLEKILEIEFQNAMRRKIENIMIEDFCKYSCFFRINMPGGCSKNVKDICEFNDIITGKDMDNEDKL